MSETNADRGAETGELDTLEGAFRAALKQGDAKSIEDCLRLVAVVTA